jgi:hypothetical protein
LRYLTNDDRAIRRSRGISLVRFFPFLLMIGAIIVMCSDDMLFRQCLGRPLEPDSGRAAAWARLIVGLACSPYYVRDFTSHWLTIATFCVGAGLAVPQIFWFRRHKAYWDSVREKGRLKRAEESARKTAESVHRTDIDQ